jgi:sulfite dehydrogenase (quinone) subunit SoeC
LHPAYSIILFTTASGAGYGLLAWAGLLAAAGALPTDRGLALAVLGTGLGLVTAGLLSSTAHLGRPERAWRALSQWRTSWLSREAVAALATYAAAAALALDWLADGRATAPAAGLATAALATATVAATGMIYASLKPVARWRNGWTVPVYLALAAATGLLWLLALAALAGHRWRGLEGMAVAAVAGAWALKEAYWRATDGRPVASTSGTATGLGHLGRVRLLDPPHTEGNYLLREMGHRVARRHARRLRLAARALAFAAPLALAAAAFALGGPPALWPLGAACATAGTLIERWLFFAEARHTVMLYYGAETA